MKEVRTYFDSTSGTTYSVNVRTGIVRERGGAMADHETEARIVRAVRSRIASQAARSGKDAAMRSLGMVKVRGALGGTYWE